MAVTPDSIKLKSTFDSSSTILSGIARSASQRLAAGELLVGLGAGSEGIYVTPSTGSLGLRLNAVQEVIRGDYYFNNVLVLFNGQGPETSTTLTSQASNAFVFTKQGTSVAVSNTDPAFGPNSLHFNGGYLTSPSTSTVWSQFVMGLQFTMDLWIKFTDISSNYGITGFRPTSSVTTTTDLRLYLDATTALIKGEIRTTAGAFTVTAPAPVTTGVWYHLALVRNSGELTLYLDGVAGSVVPVSGTHFFHPGFVQLFSIGSDYGALTNPPSSNRFKGYIDDFRLTNNVARYLRPFTKPNKTIGLFYEEIDLIQLDQLNDVVITNPTVNNVLSWNGTSWVNSAYPNVSINTLSDVNITSPANGDFLYYDGSNWVNKPSLGLWSGDIDGGDFD